MAQFFEHSFIKPGKIEKREYQENIAKKALTGNTLVVMPTALGKTIVAGIVIAEVLNKTNKKILFLAPTKPLVTQHYNSLRDILTLPDSAFTVLTGEVKKSDREQIFEQSMIISATPQTIRNELQKGRLNLKDVGLLVVDECHRSVSRYSYVEVAKRYLEQAENPLVLGLTASPSSEKLKEICENLSIKNIEVRTESDPDVVKYIPRKEVERIFVELPPELEKIRSILNDYYDDCVEKLFDMGFIHTKRLNKVAILRLQEHLIKKKIFSGIPYSTALLKVQHALLLIETQGVFALHKYLKKVDAETARTSKMMMKNHKIKNAFSLTMELYNKGIEHPKLDKLEEIVKAEFELNPETKLIIFANYRDSAQKIVDKLAEVENARVVRFVGQATKKQDIGLKQTKQEEILLDFRAGKYNTLVATSVAEEGLDIVSVDTVIFYEPVPSEIRKIQRAGRTGRKRAGKVMILITKGTKDEIYYWMSHRKEKKMHKALEEVKAKKEAGAKKGQLNLSDFNG